MAPRKRSTENAKADELTVKVDAPAVITAAKADAVGEPLPEITDPLVERVCVPPPQPGILKDTMADGSVRFRITLGGAVVTRQVPGTNPPVIHEVVCPTRESAIDALRSAIVRWGKDTVAESEAEQIDL